MSKAFVFGAFVVGSLISGGVGWGVRDYFADQTSKAEAKAALAAQARATEDVRSIEAKSRAAIDTAALSYDALRTTIEAKAVTTETKIREIYRNVPAPPVDCAVPDAGRQLLIDAGARGSASGVPTPTIGVDRSLP